MKKIAFIILGMLALIPVFTSCSESDSDVYNALPSGISKFVTQYFPNPDVASYKPSADGYTVVINNGPTITFDKDMQWTSVSGNGSVLPQVLIFDQLPPSLYEYLQQTNQVNDVFEISRTDKIYTVYLLNDVLTFDIATGQITGRK